MNNISRTLMIISLVCVIICFAACMWLTFTLKGDDVDTTFYVMDVIFFGAIVWLALNLKNLKK